MKKRLLAMLLCLCMVLTLLPVTAFAAGESAIQPGASGIPGYDSVNGYNYIYMGTDRDNPIKWRVLDDRTNTGTDGLFLLSDVCLGTGIYGDVYFDNTAPYSNAWQGSDAQAWCASFEAGSLSTQELAAVLETTKSDDAFTSSTYSIPFAASNNILENDQIFFLSAGEAENSAYGFADDAARVADYGASAGAWWLRSPHANITTNAGIVYGDGGVRRHDVINDRSARPAFNLDKNFVLLTSAAEGGKASGTVGESALTAVSTTTPTEWKLTLKDDSRRFGVGTTAYDGTTKIVTVAYTGATVGASEYISAIIKDSRDKITYYGRIAEPGAAEGTAQIDLSGVTMNTGDTLHIFSEQYNGDKKTDYASDLKEVSFITATPSPLAFGSKTAGYATAPNPQTVTIKNTGNQSVTVNLPTSAHYDITAGTGFSGSTAILAANGATADFTVQPKTGLAVNSYNETITVSGTDSTSAAVAVTFSVNPRGGGGGSTAAHYRLTFETNGGGAISSITRESYATVDLTLSKYIPAREGFAFTGWYSDKALTDKITSVRLTKNMTVYAGWNDKTSPNPDPNPNTDGHPFTDVKESGWFFNDVMFVYDKGLMAGTDDTTFSPYDTTTRAMVATTIWRMEGEPKATGANGFTDVENGKWYAEAITWAAENGIAKGCGGGLFGTNDPVTREQLAGFFYSYAKYKGYDAAVTGSIEKFPDKGDISDWAAQAVKWAIGCGLIEGRTGNMLDPKGNATRAEFAAMLHRFIIHP